MHELGIVHYIIRDVREVALENGVTHVSKVVMDIGEVSTVVPEYLTDCWDWTIRKEEPLLEGCKLEINILEAVTHCDACSKDYPTVKFGKTCPHCGSPKTWLLRGNEIEIKEIETI